MFLHNQGTTQPSIWRLYAAILCQNLLLENGVAADVVVSDAGTLSESVVVTTPAELQEAVRSGLRHVIINDHMDLTQAPRFSETTVLDSSVLAVGQTRSGQYTASIQGNCSGPVPSRAFDPVPKFRQCVLTVREDFLEATLIGSRLWLSNLYVTLPAVPAKRNHSALVAVLGPDMYLTDMAFVADGEHARALDVGGDRRVFISHSHFSGFDNNQDAAIRLEPGARATVTDSIFTHNTAARGGGDDTGSGPVMGLNTGVTGTGAAAWFHDCLFRGNIAPAPGDVAVSDRASRVFSNTRLPTVWDRSLEQEVDPWHLEPLESHQSPRQQPDVFGPVASEGGTEFLRPADTFYQQVRKETEGLAPQSRDLALLPGNEYNAADPYIGDDGRLIGPNPGGGGGSLSSGEIAVLIFGLFVGAVFLATVLWLFLLRRRRSRQGDSTCTAGPEVQVTPSQAVSKESSKATLSLAATPSARSGPESVLGPLAGTQPQPPPRRHSAASGHLAPPGGRSAIGQGTTLRLVSGGAMSSMSGMPPQSSMPSQLSRPPSSGQPSADGGAPASTPPPSHSTPPSSMDVGSTPPLSSFGNGVSGEPRRGGGAITADGFTESQVLSLEPREPPLPGASARERLEYLAYQLDTLANRVVLGGLLLEPGASNRMHGGQAVIQFAKERHSGRRYALKFFLAAAAFEGEVALYTDRHSPLGRFLPHLRTVAGAPGHDPPVTDAHGRALPPCIVMEKGESLDVWLQRNDDGVDMVTGLQVIQHVAERLSDLHQAGYVHRDLKLSNIMWLPRENRWTLIDFGCAARIGEAAPLAATLKYSPPEVVWALQQGVPTVTAAAAMDAWALGIIAMELLTRRNVLAMMEGRDMVMAKIIGRVPLPWEHGADGSQQLLHKLGRFRGAVLGLLHRDPLLRLDAGSFVRRCRAVLEHTRMTDMSSTLGAARPARPARGAGATERLADRDPRKRRR